MREVNNNTVNAANLNFQGVSPSKKDVPTNEPVEVTDLGKMPADVIGRSQVTKPAIEEDMALFMKNPDAIVKANAFADMLMQEYHIDYEKACEIATSAAKEFSK